MNLEGLVYVRAHAPAQLDIAAGEYDPKFPDVFVALVNKLAPLQAAQRPNTLLAIGEGSKALALIIHAQNADPQGLATVVPKHHA